MLDSRFFARHYLQSRRRLLYLLLVFLVTILIFAYLFDASRSELFYLDGILIFFSLIFLIWDISVTFQAYRKLLVYEEVHAESPLEAQLLVLLQEMQEQSHFQQAEDQARFSELLDYYSLWVHQIKTPIAASQLLVQDLEGESKRLLEQEIFKIDRYANLVLQYLRLESFHEDLVLRRESLDAMVKEVVRQYALFFIQKGLSLNLHDLE